TVTGASPVVDVQNVHTENVMPRSVLDALPYTKTFVAYTNMLPGVTTNGVTTGGTLSQVARDVGGASGEYQLGLGGHGSDPGMTSIDGTKTLSLFSADWRRLNLSDVFTQEVVIETGGGSAEAWSGGVNVNVVPKDGGNTFRGVASGAYTGEGLDTNNLTDALRARGLTGTNSQKQTFDIGLGLGGAIKQDKLWFYATPRRWGIQYNIAGIYYNRTPN